MFIELFYIQIEIFAGYAWHTIDMSNNLWSDLTYFTGLIIFATRENFKLEYLLPVW